MDKDEPKTLRNSTPTKDGDKMEGQCQTPGCMSTTEPRLITDSNGKYTCPACVKRGK